MLYLQPPNGAFENIKVSSSYCVCDTLSDVFFSGFSGIFLPIVMIHADVSAGWRRIVTWCAVNAYGYYCWMHSHWMTHWARCKLIFRMRHDIDCLVVSLVIVLYLYSTQSGTRSMSQNEVIECASRLCCSSTTTPPLPQWCVDVQSALPLRHNSEWIISFWV